MAQNVPLRLKEPSPRDMLGTLCTEYETAVLRNFRFVHASTTILYRQTTNSQEVCRPSCALQLALDEQSERVPGL
jgi:hypothetical protein